MTRKPAKDANDKSKRPAKKTAEREVQRLREELATAKRALHWEKARTKELEFEVVSQDNNALAKQTQIQVANPEDTGATSKVGPFARMDDSRTNLGREVDPPEATPAPQVADRNRDDNGPATSETAHYSSDLASVPRPTHSRWRSVSQFCSWLVKRPFTGGFRFAWAYLRLRRSQDFDTATYLSTAPDVARAGLNPLMHYIEHGAREGRLAKPRLDDEAQGDMAQVRRAPVGEVSQLRQVSAIRRRSNPKVTIDHVDASADQGFTGLAEPTMDDIVADVAKSGLFDVDFYRQAHPNISGSNLSPLEHYCVIGWKQGRRPNPYFDGDWYLGANPAVADAGVNPLWHYIAMGEHQGRQPCPFFDPTFYSHEYGLGSHQKGRLADYLAHVSRGAWRNPMPLFDVAYYLTQNEDVANARTDPVLHYATTGHLEGRDPSAHFRTSYYRAKYLNGDLTINPLVHYQEFGRERAFFTIPGPHDFAEELSAQIRHWASPGASFEEFAPSTAPTTSRGAKVVAFYLPQYHTIPENDRWWGKGFTEWRNVMRGVPRFSGHYQPRIPRDLGFYDLESSDIMRRQIELARDAGLYGFAFYYYWFNGKRLLERPVERFLRDATLDFPFCLVWANENWTRRWDGEESEVLLRQEYRSDHDVALVEEFQRHFVDPRYIRIGGRPLLIIYRLDIVPQARKTIARWRKLWKTRHGEKPLIFLAQTFQAEDPREFGMDGAVEFPPHKLTQDRATINSHLQILDPAFSAKVYDYDSIVSQALAEPYPPYPLVKTVVPSWDNDARRQGTGLVLQGSTPEKYERWLAGSLKIAAMHPVYGEPLVFVNAWNEWAEAAYLEPDVHYGSAYLNATARAITDTRQEAKRRILLVGHDAHPYGAQINLKHIGETLRNQFGCEVAFLLRGDGELVAAYEQLGEVCVADNPDAARAFIDELRAAGYQLALTNTAAAGSLVPLLKAAEFRTVSLIHELPGMIDEYDLHLPLEHILEASDAIVVAAKNVVDGLCTRSSEARERVTVRPQGLYRELNLSAAMRARARQRLKLPDGARMILGMGSGDLRKGLDIFMHAAKLAVSTTDDMHFVWVGKLNDDSARWLHADVRDGLDSRLQLVPYTDDVAPYFAAADAFFLSSREDPYPSVVLEAMRVGLPVVALLHATGIEELVSQHGRVVDRNDLPAMVQSLCELARSDDQSARSARQELIQNEFRFDDYCFDLLRLLDPDLHKVTVVVPNFNYGDYLLDRMESIFDQTYPVFEIIVLDDHSSDASMPELKRIQERTARRFRVVRNRENSGSTFCQWVRGGELSRGDYVWIAEADDLSRPGFLERLLRRMGQGDVAFAFSDSAQIDEHGHQLGTSYKDYYRTSAGTLLDHDFALDGESFVRNCLTERNLILNVSSVVWERSCLVEALNRCIDDLTQFKLAGDWYLYAAAGLTATTVAYTADTLNIHRRHKRSVTESVEKEAHVAEVARVHQAIAHWLNADEQLRARMIAYEAELAKFVGLAEEVGDERLQPSKPRSGRGSGKPKRDPQKARHG
jgi:glycosyltransferase involved in cell wall biosynthesis